MKHEFSAGGIVIKIINKTIYILLAQHSQHHGWVFPKGLIGDEVENESREEAAIREVEEETGVEAKITAQLSPTKYQYQYNSEERGKTVFYFIMEYISENNKKKDDEMENIEWIDFNEVKNKLTYPSDKKVWDEARQIIKKDSSDGHS